MLSPSPPARGDTASRWPSVNQEEGVHQEPDHAAALVSDFWPPGQKRNKYVLLEPPACGVVTAPELTEAGRGVGRDPPASSCLAHSQS